MYKLSEADRLGVAVLLGVHRVAARPGARSGESGGARVSVIKDNPASALASKLWAGMNAEQKKAFVKRRQLARWGDKSPAERRRIMRRVTRARLLKRQAAFVANYEKDKESS